MVYNEGMKIKSKIVWVFLPIVILSILSVSMAVLIPARTSIERIAQNYLKFKTDVFHKEVIKQYELLMEGELLSNETLLRSTQSGLIHFAKSRLVEYRQTAKGEEQTDWVVLALNPEGEIELSTADLPFSLTSDESRRLLSHIRQSLGGDTLTTDEIPFTVMELGGDKQVFEGFYFAPFNLYYLIAVKEKAYFSVIDSLLLISGIILVVFILFSFGMTLLLARYLTRPISHIKHSMETIIESGDLSLTVPIEYNDETGQLAHTFNIMTSELNKAYTQIKNYAFQAVLARNDEAKIRNIFQKYVPQDLIDKYFEHPESMLVGDNRKVAVLFSDIRSFTTISEGLKPDELVSCLNDYFTVMVDIILNRKGIVDKYIGDAIMAFFGAPVDHPDDPFQSVMTALEMSRLVKQFNRQQAERGRPEFRIGVGVNWGEVTVGNIGTEKKMDYTVIGDTVNLASRLEGLTKEYRQEVIISEFLYHEVKDKIPCRMLDVVAVKGKTKGVRIFAPNDRLSQSETVAWNHHNLAMRDYLRRDFRSAVAHFDQVLHLLPDDYPAQLLRERCRSLMNKPLPDNWDGVRVLLTK